MGTNNGFVKPKFKRQFTEIESEGHRFRIQTISGLDWQQLMGTFLDDSGEMDPQWPAKRVSAVAWICCVDGAGNRIFDSAADAAECLTYGQLQDIDAAAAKGMDAAPN